jgi:hypothetical protein
MTMYLCMQESLPRKPGPSSILQAGIPVEGVLNKDVLLRLVAPEQFGPSPDPAAEYVVDAFGRFLCDSRRGVSSVHWWLDFPRRLGL